MPTLADIYSAINTAKRKGSDFIQNPGTSLQQMLSQTQENLAARRARDEAIWNQAHGDPMNPLRVTDPEAFKQEVSNSMDLMSFAPAGMTVWHGSPHLFERFNLAKMGTGEGAQAYSKGMYMAENPEVARIYSADRKYVGSAMQGKPLPINYDDPKWIAQKTIDEHGDPTKAISHLQMVQRTAGKYQSPETKNAVQGALDLISNGEITPKGYLYKVDLPDTHVRRMLDWDEPLKNQPSQVRKLAKSLGMDLNDLGGDLVGKIGKGDEGKQILEKAGIRGVKYFGQEKGTKNFVVFDPNHLTILERNNQPIK